MIKPILLILFVYPPILTIAQDTTTTPLISNRAMNLFLADRIGYYLSRYDDISFDKNYITFNTSDGVFSLNHNFFQATPGDNPVKSFLVGGIKANVVNAVESGFTGKQFNNEIGLTIKQTWLSSVATHSSQSQKQHMAALRASIRYSLQAQITRKQAEFEKNLDSLKQSDVPGQDLNQVKTYLRQKFNNDMSDHYSWESARQQSDTLIETANYDLVSTSWTSISGYVPILPLKYPVAETLNSSFETKYGYPISLTISHTRFLESRTTGRFFITLSGETYLNNTVHSQALETITSSAYPNHLYIGSYKNFLTPVAKAEIIYFPPDSHVGFNLAIEQNIGTYNALNGIVGIPIVLIDKAGHPAANFQFQFRFFDISNTILPNRTFYDKTSVGLTLGVPFSKIIY
jgi:hypothetical protein